ncbi:UNVERIFIED_CONTAM: hypothetical protein K2H54_061081 [Gekko kuhli]
MPHTSLKLFLVLRNPEPVKHCRKSALFQLAEISSSTSHSGPSELTKQCGTSALFQLAEVVLKSWGLITTDTFGEEKLNDAGCQGSITARAMCLASEEVKVQEPGKAKLEASNIIKALEETEKMEVEEPEKAKVKAEKSQKVKSQELEKTKPRVLEKVARCSHVADATSDSTPLSGPNSTKAEDFACHSHELTMADISTLGLIKPEKLKKKKKKNKLDRQTLEKCTPKKTCKKRQSSESDIESVIYTIEAVAKGDWGAERLLEMPGKKVRLSSTMKGNFFNIKSPKKKVKSKEKRALKEKCLETTKESKPPDFFDITDHKDLQCEVPASIKPEPLTPTEEVMAPNLPEQVKIEDSDCSKKTETCGSRKSERACKGALYKTLVSEGMLTSLRANVDRGMH